MRDRLGHGCLAPHWAISSAVAAAPLRVVERAGERLQRVRQHGTTRFQRFERALRAAGQVDDQRPTADARHSPAQRARAACSGGPRRASPRRCPAPRSRARPGRLRRHVARRQARAAGRDDEPVARCAVDERRPDRSTSSGTSAAFHLVAELLSRAATRRPGAVGPIAGGAAVARREDEGGRRRRGQCVSVTGRLRRRPRFDRPPDRRLASWPGPAPGGPPPGRRAHRPPDPVAALAAGLRDEPDRADLDALLDALDHVVDREGGDRRGGRAPPSRRRSGPSSRPRRGRGAGPRRDPA